MTTYVGCIDIHGGKVKQIVGGTLNQDDTEQSKNTCKSNLETNFVSEKSSSYYAKLYEEHGIIRTHVIKLGSLEENNRVAIEALKAWPKHLQIGGGINDTNAKYWIQQGADKVIVTSWLFPKGQFDKSRLERISQLVGKEHLVVDLSYFDAGGVEQGRLLSYSRGTARNSSFMQLMLKAFCKGIDQELVAKLAEWCTSPIVYAGGAKSIDDLKLVDKLSHGRVDLTFGSALDLFGGKLVRFKDCCKWNQQLGDRELNE
ncbi:hypothetical protein HII12_005282 [Brettanomyces bruxellensis]|uniref:1-(5-phosphoribosyl)-5-[(5-phosphoribosylamino)methylideneamino] imidazole-4-carboxamide isomerase n=1 Tax=Dekkera bruxellensis TaxID=5007 RepID=A0A8H6EPH1_DEKBR|nr:hypothetical protein HII12_005282 [Brettanomyces bruxellensis]